MFSDIDWKKDGTKKSFVCVSSWIMLSYFFCDIWAALAQVSWGHKGSILLVSVTRGVFSYKGSIQLHKGSILVSVTQGEYSVTRGVFSYTKEVFWYQLHEGSIQLHKRSILLVSVTPVSLLCHQFRGERIIRYSNIFEYIRIYSNSLDRIYLKNKLFGAFQKPNNIHIRIVLIEYIWKNKLFSAFQKPNNIRIRIRALYSKQIYSYLVNTFQANIIVFVLALW